MFQSDRHRDTGLLSTAYNIYSTQAGITNATPVRILYIGSSSPLSWKPLMALLRLSQRTSAPDKFHICAIACKATHQSSTLVNIPVVDIRADSLASLAYTHNIPLVHIPENFVGMDEVFQAYQPDVIIVSCFAHKIPDSIRSIAPLGCFNIHPSLLPRYRGADPLFWQFKAGECVFGTTLHRMSAEMDSGDIISQKALAMPDGSCIHEATHLLAHGAGELLLQFMRDLSNGISVETAQNHQQATYQGSPATDDYIIDHTWSARRIYNFICAYEQPGRYFKCIINDRTFLLRKALCWQLLPWPDSAGLSFNSLPFEISSDPAPINLNSHSRRSLPHKQDVNSDSEITIACATGYIRCMLQAPQRA
ncbi:MAG TPA: hypothetical protein ENJ08_15495 [Gammaproteobacteria bacterium]|nr:hypothetical protein [Gammaproteobacteria bacterium]